MSFSLNKFLSSLFGNKASRDMKEIKPFVDKILAVEPEIKQLSNDELRAKTDEIKAQLQDLVKDERAHIAELNARIKETEIDQRQPIFDEIDKTEKDILDIFEDGLNQVLPTVFAIVKETARRFAENEHVEVTATDFDRELSLTHDFVDIEGDKAIWHNHWVAGGNDTVWNMIHYDVQLFGGVVLHQGKIAEMATGEGKTLVATLPVFLNALTRNGVHVVTVNDYLAKRDSEWMGPLYMFHGLSVDCIDKHQPNSDARRKAYQADVTFGTNNEFGFDYLRDNMAMRPEELVQRSHNYAIVDEVDSVLIDDARTPLIISGPVPKGDDQMFEEYCPIVEKLVEAQRRQATELLATARKQINSDDQKEVEAGFLALFRAYKAMPKNKALIKFLSEDGIKTGLLKTEEIYMENNNRRMPEATDPLFFVVDEKQKSVEMTDKGNQLIASIVKDDEFFILPDITGQLAELDALGLEEEERLKRKDELMQDYAVKSERVHTMQQLLKAYTMFMKDDDYVVIDGEVKIVDEQTGRIMEGRRWSDGLHQAVEAKERVKVEAATQTFATITLQNYFRMYHKLAGMTGTAITEAGEFWDIYKLDVVEIPTNKPVARKDMNDRVYKTNREKYKAVI
ncbi:MAG: preprotein translocase subunit SecA, partial [Bacteroidales bacterium]|nr:preprotein translocase subunit SecA [Bacteroidales bacterium]